MQLLLVRALRDVRDEITRTVDSFAEFQAALAPALVVLRDEHPDRGRCALEPPLRDRTAPGASLSSFGARRCWERSPMPQIGPAEILVILLVGLLVFGPKRLPEIGRQVGRGLRELRKFQDTVKGELDEVLNFQDDDRRDAGRRSPAPRPTPTRRLRPRHRRPTPRPAAAAAGRRLRPPPRPRPSAGLRAPPSRFRAPGLRVRRPDPRPWPCFRRKRSEPRTPDGQMPVMDHLAELRRPDPDLARSRSSSARSSCSSSRTQIIEFLVHVLRGRDAREPATR